MPRTTALIFDSFQAMRIRMPRRQNLVPLASAFFHPRRLTILVSVDRLPALNLPLSLKILSARRLHHPPCTTSRLLSSQIMMIPMAAVAHEVCGSRTVVLSLGQMVYGEFLDLKEDAQHHKHLSRTAIRAILRRSHFLQVQHHHMPHMAPVLNDQLIYISTSLYTHTDSFLIITTLSRQLLFHLTMSIGLAIHFIFFSSARII